MPVVVSVLLSLRSLIRSGAALHLEILTLGHGHEGDEPDPLADLLHTCKTLSANASATEASPSRSLQPEEHPKPFPNIRENLVGSRCRELDASSIPIQILHVIGEDDARHLVRVRQSDLEGIAFCLTGYRARDGESCLRVVGTR